MINIKPNSEPKNNSLDIEKKLDEADALAEATNIRFTHDEVFERIRKRINTQ